MAERRDRTALGSEKSRSGLGGVGTDIEFLRWEKG
jgi:hypothetical protein